MNKAMMSRTLPGRVGKTTCPDRTLVLNHLSGSCFWINPEGIILEYQPNRQIASSLAAVFLPGYHIEEIFPRNLSIRLCETLKVLPERGPVINFHYCFPQYPHLPDLEVSCIDLPQKQYLLIFQEAINDSDSGTVSVSEKVQHKIGRDLHDGLGQSLTGIGCMATALANDLTKRNKPEAKRVQEIANRVQEAREQLRRLAHGLIPIPGGHRELPEMLQNLALDSQRMFGIQCKMWSQVSKLSMLPESVLHLYRIVQEAINNAVRHGKAKSIEIVLQEQPGGYRLVVTDDGIGFSPQMSRGEGMGLSIMQDRTQRLGGQLEVRSSPSKGTQVICSVNKSHVLRKEGRESQ